MYIGLDLGTSGLKGVLIGEDQAVLAEATARARAVARASELADMRKGCVGGRRDGVVA